MAERIDVMISSTARDLPEQRAAVMDGCLRRGVFPYMMEHLPALDAEAIQTSLEMVDKADIYLGIFAHRYGYIPKDGNPDQISITEMEYNRAVGKGIPRFIFLMHEDHPLKASEVEKGVGGEKLDALKKRLEMDRVANFFKSPEDLRGHVVNTLSEFLSKKAEEAKAASEQPKPDREKFHYVSDIPSPPEEYIAHPYTLLQTHNLIGRQDELNLLTDWVAKPGSDVYKANILSIVAIGGMGKSALTWKWFNDIAPEEMNPMAGRMWWSFYESDASFENFIIRALAYVSNRSIDEIKKIAAPDREAELLAILDKEPFLFVLDGLERILIAYARMDAAHLSDDEVDQVTANIKSAVYGLPEYTAQSFTGQHRLRKTADPGVGAFLRKLTSIRASRILVSTRLYPAELQIGTGRPASGCYALFLSGLSDNDAMDLWRSFEISGSRETLLRLFNLVENHPLLIQALASVIANDHRNPGDFDGWRDNHPDFDPFNLPLVQVRSHILEFALRGLSGKSRQVLHTIAAFRMPGQYDTLSALLIGEGKPCSDARELDAVLTELEDRGLVGWDKRANRYDLHPIVRGVVWSGLGDEARQGVYTGLQAHFESVPMIEDWEKVESLENLTPAIELYYTLIGLGRFDDAYVVFRDRLNDATLYRLSAGRQRVELLEMLFPDGVDKPPRLSGQYKQGNALNSLALAYQFSGQPGHAAPLYRRDIEICREMEDDENLSITLRNLSYALRQAGGLREAEGSARQALEISRRIEDGFKEAVSLQWLGLALAARGETEESKAALDRSLRMFIRQSNKQGEGLSSAYLAHRAVWLGENEKAAGFAASAWELAHVQRLPADIIRSARLEGEAALGLGETARAEERLHYALGRARAVNLVEEDLPALIALAELKRREGDEQAARDLLDDVWEYAERGPYPPFHSDALNVLANIERDAGNADKAIEAATEAYKKAWCDGPPYAYHWGLEKAKAHLNALKSPFPDISPFDESKFEPMPKDSSAS